MPTMAEPEVLLHFYIRGATQTKILSNYQSLLDMKDR
jgi:hypothetical protein